MDDPTYRPSPVVQNSTRGTTTRLPCSRPRCPPRACVRLRVPGRLLLVSFTGLSVTPGPSTAVDSSLRAVPRVPSPRPPRGPSWRDSFLFDDTGPCLYLRFPPKLNFSKRYKTLYLHKTYLTPLTSSRSSPPVTLSGRVRVPNPSLVYPGDLRRHRHQSRLSHPRDPQSVWIRRTNGPWSWVHGTDTGSVRVPVVLRPTPQKTPG